MPIEFTFASLKKNCDHIDPDLRVMILRDFCDLIRNGTYTKFAPQDEAVVVQSLGDRFGGAERVKDVQSEAIRTLELATPIMTRSALLTLVRSLVASAQTEPNTYFKDIRVTADAANQLRENACLAIRMILKRVAAETSGDEAAAFVAAVIDPFVATIPKQTDEPAQRDFYEVIQPILTTMGASVSAASCTALYKQLRADWHCKTTHLFNQLSAVNAALFPILPEAAFAGALETLLGDLNTRGEAFRRNLSAFIAVIRTSSARVGDKVPQLFKILNAELQRLEGGEGASDDDGTENDEARASILDSLRVLVRDCPKEAEPYLGNVVAVATTLLTWDPNYCGDDEANDGAAAASAPAAAAGGDDDNTYGGDEYGDYDDYGAYGEEDGGYGGYDAAEEQNVDDLSWKVRLSAAALLAAVLRNAQSRAGSEAALKQLLDAGASPLLVKRLKDRSEAVKAEVHDLFINGLELVSTERSVGFTAASSSSGGHHQLTNVGLAYGRDTSQQLDALPSAALFGPAQSTIAAILSAGLADKSPKVAAKAADALRKFLLVRDIEALSTVPALVAALKPLIADEASRRSVAAILPTIYQTLRFLVVRSARPDALKAAPAASAALFELTPAVAASCSDKTPSIARAAIELSAELAANGDAQAPAIFAAVSALLGSSDAEVKTAAVVGVAKILSTAEAKLAGATASLDAAYTALVDLLSLDSTRRVASAAVRSLARTNVPATYIAAFGEGLVKAINRADRQEREAAIGSLADLIAAHPAAVAEVTYKTVVTSLSDSLSISAAFVEKELTISALSFQLAAAVANSKRAAVVDALAESAAPRMLEFLTKGSVQGLPVLEAGKAFFAIGASSEANCGKTLARAEQLFASANAGNTPVAFGALVAADANKARGAATIDKLAAAAAADANMGARAAAALGEVGRFTSLVAYPSALRALLASDYKTEDIALAVTNALAKATSTVAGQDTFAQLVAAGVSGQSYVATRALRTSIAEGTLSAAQHPLSQPAVFEKALAALVAAAGATADAHELQEAVGQLAAWGRAAVLAAINGMIDSGNEDHVAAAGYALRFTLRGARSNAADREALLATATKFLQSFGRSAKVLVRRNALMLLKALLADGFYTAEAHSTAFAAAVAELSVDGSLVKLTDLGVVKHREDRGVDLRRNAFDFVRDLLAAPEASFLTAANYAAIATGTVGALGPTVGVESEEDEDIIATARRQIFAFNKIPAAWAAITTPDTALIAKYMANSLRLKANKDGGVDKKEEDNVVLAVALLVFLKSAVSGDKLAPLAEKIKEAEALPLAPRGRLLLNEILA